MVSELPHELIRQVRISTRAAAGLSDYDPSDPSLPSLPSVSAVVAASNSSPPHRRCENCKGRLLRGSESIICLYCGRRPEYDVFPEPIGFSSSIGYKWLLRSLRLDGSEIVNLKNKSEQDQGQSSPKTSSSLSDLLNYKISWPIQSEKQVTSFADKHAEESKNSSILTAAAPDEFFVKSNRNSLSNMPPEDDFFVKSSTEAPSDMPVEQSSVNNQIATPSGKDGVTADNLNLFQNVHSSEPTDSSVKHETDEDFSEWEADFQFANSESQQSGEKSSEHFAGLPVDSGNIIQDSKSFGNPPRLEVDLAAHIDSVFVPGKDSDDVKPTGNPAVSPAFGDWDSDGLWNNLSSNHPSNVDHTATSATDFFASADFLQDFQSHPNHVDMTKNKAMNEEHEKTDKNSLEDWNDFMGITNAQAPPQTALAGSQHQVSTSDQNSSEIGLFSFDNEFEGGDFGSFSQPDLFSAAPLHSSAPAEVNSIMSEIPASNWSNDVTHPSEDDVKKLISQMHDLSFMLETELSVPAGGSHNSRNSPEKD